MNGKENLRKFVQLARLAQNVEAGMYKLRIGLLIRINGKGLEQMLLREPSGNAKHAARN